MKIKVIAATQHDLLTYWAINGDEGCISNIMCRKLCCKYFVKLYNYEISSFFL